MESDAGISQGRSRRAQTQLDFSDSLPRGQQQRPQSVHGFADAAQDLRSQASQVSVREKELSRSASTAHHGSSSSRRHQHSSHRDRGRDTEIPAKSDEDMGVQAFVRQFGALDLAHASQLWASDKQRISIVKSELQLVTTDWVSPAQSFLTQFQLRNFHDACTLWHSEKKKLAEAEAKFYQLQDEVLSTVDRFQPTYDEKISEKFGSLQAAIGVFVNQTLVKAVKLDPWEKWDQSVLWEGAVNLDKVGRLPKGEEKLLARHAVWKFLAEALFDRAQPFASFGGATTEMAGRLVSDALFPDLFPDHELNEDAAKWRSLTVKQLSARSDDEQGRRHLRKELARAFAVHVLENMTSLSREEIEQGPAAANLVGSEKLHDVLKQAIAFSRLLMGERASFSLGAPPLASMKFKREKMDESTTIVGTEVNLVFNEEEDDKAGVVKLFASPMLVKYGNAGGQDLHQETVLLRAFVLLA